MRNLPIDDTDSHDDFARMHVLNPASEGRSDVQVIYISKYSVDVMSPIAVLPGTLIQLHLSDKDTFLLGEARCCETAGNRFEVGIDIQDAFKSVFSTSCAISPEC